jgi:hypothetical protein
MGSRSSRRARHPPVDAPALGEALVRDVGRMFCTAGLQLGYRYENSPICVPDGTLPARTIQKYIPSARPGSRAPMWLGGPLDPRSLWMRLRAAAARPMPDGAASDPRRRRGIPLKAHCDSAQGCGAVWAMFPRPTMATWLASGRGAASPGSDGQCAVAAGSSNSGTQIKD